MNPRLRHFGTALALLLAVGEALSAHAAPAAAPTHSQAVIRPGRGHKPVVKPVAVPSAAGTSIYAVSPGVSVQYAAADGSGSGGGSEYAASSGVSVEKLAANVSGGDGSSNLFAVSPGVSVEKLTASGSGGGGTAQFVASPGVSVEKLTATGGPTASSLFVVSPGVSVQRVAVGGYTLTTTITGVPTEGQTVCGNMPEFTFAASSTDPSPSFVFVYRIDGGTWQGPIKTTSVTIGPLSDGPHTVEVAAIDELGNEDPNPAKRTFTVDTLPPAITAVAAKPAITGATIAWTTDKPATSQVEYEAQGSTTWTKGALDTALVTAHSVTLTGLTPATLYAYRVHSADSCGQETVSAPLAFSTITDTPPATVIVSGPAAGATVCGSTATFTFTGTDAYTPVASLLYQYRLDGGAWSVPALVTTATFVNLADGLHTFEVAAVNEAGAVDPNPAKRTFSVDTLPPVLSAVAAGVPTLTSTVITWTTDKPATSQADYRVQGTSDWASTALDTTLVAAHSVTLFGLSPGKTYEFQAHSQDACGHETISPVLGFATVADTVPPDTSITVGPADGATLCASTATFTFTGTDNYTQAANLRYQYRVDGGVWSPLQAATNVTLTSLSDGSHTFEVAAVDEAGNVDATPALVHFTVDTAAPVVSALAANVQSLTSAAVTWTTDKPATSQVEFRVQGTTPWTSTAIDSTLVTAHSTALSGLTVNTLYEYRVHSTDACGHETVSAIQTLSTGIDSTPPTTSLTSGPANGAVSCAATVTFTYTGTDNVTPASGLRYETSLDGSAFSSPSTNATLTFSNVADGPHTFIVKAVDQSGNVDLTGVTIHFTVDAVAPVINAVAADPRDVRATIIWTTDKAASSQVEYGLTAAYGAETALDTSAVTSHSETISGLTPLTTYHYRVHSKDACQETVSADGMFTTSVLLVPDLSVTALTFPNPATTQSPITVSWTVLDSGPGDASGSWTDSVYLSPTATLNPATATLLGAYPAPIALQMGGQYTQSQIVTLPNVTLGTYYIIVVTNSGNTLTETTTDDNALAMPIVLLRNQTLIASPDQIPLRLSVNVPRAVTLNLSNLSSASMTGITAAVTGASPNIAVQVAPIAPLSGLSAGTAQITVTALSDSVFSDTAVVHLTDQQGDTAQVTLNISVVPNKPDLVAAPSPLSQGMTRGGTTLTQVTLTNTGSLPATRLTVGIPAAPWLALAVPAVLGDLAPGASVQIPLRLSPGITLPLGLYTGSLVVNGSNASLAVPFSFNCISSGVGGLKVVAQDEYSFNAATHPNLAKAHVVVSDVVTNAVVVDSLTSSDGTLTVPSVPEGNYSIIVTAEGHSSYHGDLAVVAGKTNEIDPFLSLQLVTYTFTVIPIDVQNDYAVSVTPVFAANVPAPVITLSPKYIDLSKLTYVNGQATVDFTVTNHGLIAADDTSLTFPARSDYRLTPAVGALGQVAAMTTIHIPITVTNLSAAANLQTAHAHLKAHDDAPTDPCTFQGVFLFQYLCGLPVHKNDTVGVTTGLCGALTRIPPTTPQTVPNEPYFVIPPNNNSGDTDNGPGNLYPQVGGPPIKVNRPSFCDPCTAARLDALVTSYIALTPAQDCIDTYDGIYKTSDLLAAQQQGSFKYIQAAGHAAATVNNGIKCAAALTAAPETFGLSLVVPDPKNLTPEKLIKEAESVLHACDGLPPSSSKFNNFLTSVDTHLARYEPFINAFADGFGEYNTHDFFSSKGAADAAKISRVVGRFDELINRKLDVPRAKQPGQIAIAAPAQTLSDLKITDAERQELLALPLPSQVTAADANNMVDRWNRTVDYAGAGIYNLSDVPAGQSTDFIALDKLMTDYAAADAAVQADRAEGISDPAVGLSQSEGMLEQAILAPQSDGTCAEVQLQLDQNVAITRTAFKATLQLNDSAQNVPLSSIKVSLKVIDQAGNDQTALFVIGSPTVTGLSAVDGTGTLVAGGSGTATWTILPTRQAAANGTMQYFVSGEIDYTQSGIVITIPLLPTGITVVPDPYLAFHYFLQRDVYSDDPFTPQIEPAEPFSLGLIVDNAGQGTARNLTITSSQPKIIDNQKGLDVAFQILGTQVNTSSVTPSLTVNLGDITPGGTGVADFLLTASLSGQFISDSATFKHTDRLGNAQTSLIDSVDTHSLEHVVRVVDPLDDNKPDFLVDDIPDANNLPDTLWNSDGTVSPVAVALSGTVSGTVSNAPPSVLLTVPAVPSGFVYIRLADPGQNIYQLASVVRSDGKVIALGDNAWTTHRIVRLQGQAPYLQNRLYIFDDNSTGQYTVTYAPMVPIPPTVALTSPHNGDTFSPNTTLSVAATASSLQAIVKELDFYDGSTLIGSSQTVPYTIPYLPGIGLHTLTAVATDANGTAGTSSSVTINVSAAAAPPNVRITGPADGIDLFAPAAVIVSASASEAGGTIAKLDFYSNGNFLGSAGNAPYTTTLGNLPAGTYLLTAVATDTQGRTAASAPITVTVEPSLTTDGAAILRVVAAVRQTTPGQMIVTVQNSGGTDAVNLALVSARIKWGGQSPISISPATVPMLTPNSSATFTLQFPPSAAGPFVTLNGTYSGRSFTGLTRVTP